MDAQAKATAFRALHDRPGVFVMPNAWDGGSAKLLARLGFEALATTSAGLAYGLGKPDGKATRAESLANARALADASALPVSADLENGFGHEPAECAETIRLAAAVGVVGGSIEDASGDPADPIYPFALAVERVAAAVRAARTLPLPFVLTAPAENLIPGRPDLPDPLRRLEAYAAAGADVLFAPGLRGSDQIAAVVRAVAPKPVNVIMGLGAGTLSVDDLRALGVKRISVGSSLARAAYGAFLKAAEEIRATGTFAYANAAVPYQEMNEKLEG